MHAARSRLIAFLLLVLLPMLAAGSALTAAASASAASTFVAEVAEPASAEPAEASTAPSADDPIARIMSLFQADEGGLTIVGRVVGALLIFIGGWIFAKLLAYGVYQLLARTDIDNRVLQRLGLSNLVPKPKEGEQGGVERVIAQFVYYIAMLMVVIAVLDFAGLEKVANPLEGLVGDVADAIPAALLAGIILVVAYIVARVAKAGIMKVLDRVGLDRRFAQLAGDGERTQATPFSQLVGTVAFWLIVVLGLASALEALGIEAIAEPMRNAIDSVVAALPSVAIAALYVAVGYIGGRIVRAVLRTLLQSIGFDKLAERVGLDKVTGTTSPSDIVGIVAMAFIILQASIAALDEVGLRTLSGPLTQMMSQFWEVLPALAISALIVAVGVFVGQLLRRVVAAALRNMGFERLMERLGFKKLAERKDRLGEYSELVGFVLQVAVILIATAQALDNLDLATWAGYLNSLLSYAIKNAAVALLIVGVGFAIGNYVRDLVRARAGEGDIGRWMGEFSRYAVLVFAFTAAVAQLDVAEEFVLITFGLLFGALCFAAALAFGLGGREVAGDILKKRYDQARFGSAPPSPPPQPGRRPTGTPGG